MACSNIPLVFKDFKCFYFRSNTNLNISKGIIKRINCENIKIKEKEKQRELINKITHRHPQYKTYIKDNEPLLIKEYIFKIK